MFLEGESFARCCANEFAFNMGAIVAAVWPLTGLGAPLLGRNLFTWGII